MFSSHSSPIPPIILQRESTSAKFVLDFRPQFPNVTALLCRNIEYQLQQNGCCDLDIAGTKRIGHSLDRQNVESLNLFNI